MTVNSIVSSCNAQGFVRVQWNLLNSSANLDFFFYDFVVFSLEPLTSEKIAKKKDQIFSRDFAQMFYSTSVT